MPGYNKTGPMGQGSMTGRKMGKCTNFGANQKNQQAESTVTPDEAIPENIQGRGLGCGFGRGRRGRGLGMGRQNRWGADN